MCLPSDSVDEDATVVLQSIATAQMLNAEAMGPKVPANQLS